MGFNSLTIIEQPEHQKSSRKPKQLQKDSKWYVRNMHTEFMRKKEVLILSIVK